MINFKIIITKIPSLLFVILLFIQCASSQKIENVPPVVIKDSYFQEWIAGIQEGGSGFIVHFSVEENPDIILKRAYFKGKEIMLAKNTDASYTGRYTHNNLKKDLIMSDDPKEEFRNKVPVIEEKIPFELKNHECIIVYNKHGKEGVFSIDHLREKEVEALPMQKKQ